LMHRKPQLVAAGLRPAHALAMVHAAKNSSET